MSNDTRGPHKGHLQFDHEPGAVELLALEKRYVALQEEKRELDRPVGVMANRSRRRSEVSAELRRIHSALITVREYVRASKTQTEIYEKDKAHAENARQAENDLTLRKDLLTTRKSKQVEPTKEQLSEYLAAWKEAKPVEQQTQAAKMLERDRE